MVPTKELCLLDEDLTRMPFIELHDYPGAVDLAQHLLDLLHIRVGHCFLFANSSTLLLGSIRVDVERVDDPELAQIQIRQIRCRVAVRGHLSTYGLK